MDNRMMQDRFTPMVSELSEYEFRVLTLAVKRRLSQTQRVELTQKVSVLEAAYPYAPNIETTLKQAKERLSQLNFELAPVVRLRDLETGDEKFWTVSEVLDYINDERSPNWTPYTEEDWLEGWDEWCADMGIYELVNYLGGELDALI